LPLYKKLATKQWWAELWLAIKYEVAHYKAGFQLLWTDIGISTRLLRKTLNGKKLTRRERNQVGWERRVTLLRPAFHPASDVRCCHVA